VRGNKWTPKVITLTREYAISTSRPNVSGLSGVLGVSRRCIYDWSIVHKEFRMVLNEMRHGAIDRIHVPEDELVDPLDEVERIEKVIRKKVNDRVSQKVRDAKRKAEIDPPAEINPNSTADMLENFEDELGDDDEWEIDDE
jgi:chemotaxis response regulator CheB